MRYVLCVSAIQRQSHKFSIMPHRKILLVALKPTAVPRPTGSKTDTAGLRNKPFGIVRAGIYVVILKLFRGD